MSHDNDWNDPTTVDPTDPDIEPDTLIIEDQSLRLGFIQLPKAILYARNLSRDAKLLYAVLLGYAWQEQRCWPGYGRLCQDLGASENSVTKYMRELEAVGLLRHRRRGLGRTNIYFLTDLRTAKIEVQEPQLRRTAKIEVPEPNKTAVPEPNKTADYEETVEVETEEKEPDLISNGTHQAADLHKNVFHLKKTALCQADVENSAAAPDSVSRPAGVASVGRVLAQRALLRTGPGEPGGSPGRGRPPKAPPYLAQVMTEFSVWLHDEEHTRANITRATRLWKASGMAEERFVVDVLYQARSLTQQQGGVKKRATDGYGAINRMPYFFAVVEDLLGLRDPQREHNTGAEVTGS